MKYRITVIVLLLTITFQFAFGQKASHVIFPATVLTAKYPDYINTCELADHKKELIYTRFIYSGIDEYWGLHSPDKKCKEINADLKIPNEVVLKPEFAKLISDVHENYWKSYLIIDAVGTFVDDKVSGYGHLGSNNSQFILKQIINIQIVTKEINRLK